MVKLCNNQTHVGMGSPLLGIAAVNSLLFTAYNVSKRVINPFPEHTLPQIALAGSMAGAANSVLASPGKHTAYTTTQVWICF